jgi:sigma-B regulation protein RsbU (phosphoserine phosphatase)
LRIIKINTLTEGVIMDTKANLIENIKRFYKAIFIFLLLIILYVFAAFTNDIFINFMSVASYLTWHIIFEFSSILVAFSVFSVTYFIYEESGSLKMIVLGCAFLIMGLLDAFHTLSFKGMTDFFVSNATANRATTLWVLSRIFGSLGFLAAINIPSHFKCQINKNIFAACSIVFSIILLMITTYYPNVFPAMLIEGMGLTKVKIFMEYLIILIMTITLAMVYIEYKKTNTRREYMFMIALIVLIFSEFAFTNYGSVYDAFNYIGHIYKIIAYLIFYKAIYIENISEPYREMKKARYELKEYSDNLNLIVKQRTKELEEVNAMLMNDIEYAKEMQRCLLPTQMPQDPSISFNAEYLSAERLSGDFYNVVKLDEDNIVIYIGDVSGHGVSAAMLTVFAYQNITPMKDEEDKSVEIISPGYVLKNIYKGFNKTNFNVETYIVMIYGIYNIKSKLFTYSSAGMNVSPYIIKKSGEILELDSKGFPICKLGEYIMPFYDNRTVQLDSGDKIMFYSDGLIEVKNLKNEIYGQQNMKDFLMKYHNLNAKELQIKIKNNLYSHIGKDGKLMDDATFLIMQIN